MFGLGMPEMLLILALVVLVFGANKLPELGAGLGKGIRNFKEATRKPLEIDVTPKPQEKTEQEKPKEEQA